MHTIVALATPLGRSAIGVVRLSGPSSGDILRALVQERSLLPAPGHVSLKSIKNPQTAEVMDQALVTYFQAPHSFTGEDVVEISCHGSPVLLRRIVDLLLSLGARLADPGEFTLRALHNGKLDLTQAEAIRDLINAQTQAAARQAVRQLEGAMSAALEPLQNKLLDIIVLLESALEFVEDDLPDLQALQIRMDLAALASQVAELCSTYETGHLLREGLRVTITGRPNAGKSSLFNSLLAMDRAIVTEIPGTTRDSLSEQMSLEGIPILLTDTAGVRDAQDVIESLGVERTYRSIADADILLVVIDGTGKVGTEDMELLSRTETSRRILLVNKCDLPSYRSEMLNELRTACGRDRVIAISAKTGAGLLELKSAMLEPFGSVDSEDVGFLMTDARHYDLLRRSQEEFKQAESLLEEGASEEIILVGLHNALKYFGQVTGETTSEDVLSRVFATFCIGK